MKTAKRLVTLLMVGVTFIYAGSSYAGTAEKVASKDSYQRMYCDKYMAAQDTVDVEIIFEDMDKGPYSQFTNEFWTAAECESSANMKTKVPMIFNSADDVIASEDFPRTVREYLIDVKKDNSTWYKIINSKSTDGLTFLDYMTYNISYGRYGTTETLAAANRIVQYLCKNGGEYSKYKQTMKCQQ